MGDCKFPYTIIAGTRELASQFGMLDPDEVDKQGMPLTARCVRCFLVKLYDIVFS